MKLKSFQSNSVKGKKYDSHLLILMKLKLTYHRILIILDLEVLKDLGEAEKIGEPKALEVKAEEEETAQPTAISSNGFYGNKPQPAPAQPAKRPQSSAPPASAHATIYPIEAISPYSNKWTMKANEYYYL